MSQTDNPFIVGVPISVRPVTANSLLTFSTRIVDVSQHSFSFAIPYDNGKILLWPIGHRLELSIPSENHGSVVFTAEIIPGTHEGEWGIGMGINGYNLFMQLIGTLNQLRFTHYLPVARKCKYCCRQKVHC